jgi:precorrin-6B methylase 2
MPASVSKFLPRHDGTTKTIDFVERPVCKHCKNAMKIVKTSAVGPIVGLLENYDVSKVYYRCGRALCPGGDNSPISPENKIYPYKSDYDHEVYAKVAELRWSHKHTYEEIIDKMNKQYKIVLNLATIERMLKIYEIGCSEKYKPEIIEAIKKNGGVLLTIDGMRPSPGNPGLYTIYDYFTGLTIHSKRLKSESTVNIAKLLEIAKKRISKELDVPVVGVMSDALPAQRKAIEEALPDVPHCLCHYHFYKFVFNAPKKLDSNLMTQTRIFLKNLWYLKKSTIFSNQGKDWEPEYSLTRELIEILRNLSKWKPRPKDPYFVGLESFSRLTDVNSILDAFLGELGGSGCQFEDEPVIRDLHLKISDYIKSKSDIATELGIIKEYLAEIKTILDDIDVSADKALDKLEQYSKILDKRLVSENCFEKERRFIEALHKYLKNKGKLLFNYKRIEGAPKTNNSHELAFKQLKHFLRRVIGFQTANHYLLSHGERIVFVNPHESFKGILEILKKMDHQKARKLIRSERTSRDSIRYILHDPERWAIKIEELKKKFKDLLESLLMKT